MGTPKALPCGEALEGAVICMTLFFRHFLEHAFFSIFFDVGSILGGFGRPKWRPKSIFGRFFGMFFSKAILASNFDRIFRLETLKIAISSRREHDFHKIDVFEKVSKKPRF